MKRLPRKVHDEEFRRQLQLSTSGSILTPFEVRVPVQGQMHVLARNRVQYKPPRRGLLQSMSLWQCAEQYCPLGLPGDAFWVPTPVGNRYFATWMVRVESVRLVRQDEMFFWVARVWPVRMPERDLDFVEVA